MIAGLESISHGQLLIDGKLANDLPPRNAAWPWCSSPMRFIRT
jgi:hypothetical protein